MALGCGTVAKIGGVVAIILGIFFYFEYFYVVSDGVKEGHLNYMTYKGYLFKTYEGKLVLTGFRNGNSAVQSNEFTFSVENDSLAKILETCTGKEMQLRYKEYNKMLPWRGYTEFVVYDIMSVDGAPYNKNLPNDTKRFPQ